MKNGFVKKSQKGSHVKFIKGDLTVIIPHPKKEIPLVLSDQLCDSPV